MSVNGVYFGNGIEISKEQLADVLDFDDVDEVADSDYIYYIRAKHEELYDKLENLNLMRIDKDHKDNIYFGQFIRIGDDWGDTKITANQKLQLLELIQDDKFKEICVKLFEIEPTLMTIVSGCLCCT